MRGCAATLGIAKSVGLCIHRLYIPPSSPANHLSTKHHLLLAGIRFSPCKELPRTAGRSFSCLPLGAPPSPLTAVCKPHGRLLKLHLVPFRRSHELLLQPPEPTSSPPSMAIDTGSLFPRPEAPAYNDHHRELRLSPPSSPPSSPSLHPLSPSSLDHDERYLEGMPNSLHSEGDALTISQTAGIAAARPTIGMTSTIAVRTTAISEANRLHNGEQWIFHLRRPEPPFISA